MNGSRGAGPSPDGRHDDLAPEELDGLTLQVPDDPRALENDPATWDDIPVAGPTTGPTAGPTAAPTWADRRAARRRRLSLTAGIVAASMVVVALSGAVGAWIVGPQASAPAAVPLATVSPDAGQVGGLLPADAVLQNGSASIAARSLRPAVIAVIPAECDECAELLSTLAPQVGSFGFPLIAVGAPAQTDQLAALTDDVGGTRLTSLTDPQGALRTAFGGTGVTLLLVRDDGVVVQVVRDPTPDTRIEAALVEMAPAAGLNT
jgi:hypothetical protein